MLPKAWQRQIREAKEQMETKVAPPVKLNTATVRECTRTLAKKIILEYEWLGTMPLSSWHTGIFFDEWRCGGVSVFCVGGGGVNVHKSFGVQLHDMAYLARGACVHWTPPGTASKLIGHSLRIAGRRGLKVAIAYADTDAGEIGTVYQASNWLCLGKGAATMQMVHPITGRVYDQKISFDRARAAGGGVTRKEARQFLLDRGWTEQPSNSKIRYARILVDGKEGLAIRGRIEHLIVPYPKRQKDSSEPSSLRLEEGGAAPTLALHTNG